MANLWGLSEIVLNVFCCQENRQIGRVKSGACEAIVNDLMNKSRFLEALIITRSLSVGLKLSSMKFSRASQIFRWICANS